MYFKGLTFIFSEDPPENHLMVIGGLLLKYYVLLLLLLLSLLLLISWDAERLFLLLGNVLAFGDHWRRCGEVTVVERL